MLASSIKPPMKKALRRSVTVGSDDRVTRAEIDRRLHLSQPAVIERVRKRA
jgi:hypothetical protein